MSMRASTKTISMVFNSHSNKLASMGMLAWWRLTHLLTLLLRVGESWSNHRKKETSRVRLGKP